MKPNTAPQRPRTLPVEPRQRVFLVWEGHSSGYVIWQRVFGIICERAERNSAPANLSLPGVCHRGGGLLNEDAKGFKHS